MVRATLHFTVRAGAEQAFEAVWRRIADEVRREPGNLRQALLRDPDDPSTFVVTSDWRTREAFERFERSAAQEELTAPLRALRESARQVVQELVTHVEGGA